MIPSGVVIYFVITLVLSLVLPITLATWFFGRFKTPFFVMLIQISGYPAAYPFLLASFAAALFRVYKSRAMFSSKKDEGGQVACTCM